MLAISLYRYGLTLLCTLFVLLYPVETAFAQETCGDVNDDFSINILDITFLIGYLYDGGQAPDPLEIGDVNGDGQLNILDISYLIVFLYQFGPDPDCDADPVILTYPIVGTGQSVCYDTGYEITCPTIGQAFYGQDATFGGNQPVSYTDNGNGTITDNITGLIWQKYIDAKVTFTEAVAAADTFSLAGYTDWRLPTIKEQYSLILFSGLDPSGYEGSDTSLLTPFIDSDYFEFEYGNEAAGERIIDAQYFSSTEYVSTTMNGDATVFGVNFADGRIKGYPRDNGPGGTPFEQFVRYVRGNPDYGINDFQDNGDGTITDSATGLIWMQDDSGQPFNWEEAMNFADTVNYAGQSDWRLPTAKELQSIVDYTRSPATTFSAAIDPIFNVSTITDEGGGTNYPFYWSATTHANWTGMPGTYGAYVCFGEALGWMEVPPGSSNYQLWDVHGAGAQRSDPKEGNPGDWPYGHGPQGDVIRIYNYVRCVRALN